MGVVRGRHGLRRLWRLDATASAEPVARAAAACDPALARHAAAAVAATARATIENATRRTAAAHLQQRLPLLR